MKWTTVDINWCQNSFIQTPTVESTCNKMLFSHCKFFSILCELLCWRPSHHASSHCRQYDSFSQWKIHNLPNRTLPFLHPSHDPVLYISAALDLPRHSDSETGTNADRSNSRNVENTDLSSLCLTRREKQRVRKEPLPTQTETGSTVHIGTCPSSTSCFHPPSSPPRVHLHRRLCTRIRPSLLERRDSRLIACWVSG